MSLYTWKMYKTPVWTSEIQLLLPARVLSFPPESQVLNSIQEPRIIEYVDLFTFLKPPDHVKTLFCGFLLPQTVNPWKLLDGYFVRNIFSEIQDIKIEPYPQAPELVPNGIFFWSSSLQVFS